MTLDELSRQHRLLVVAKAFALLTGRTPTEAEQIQWREALESGKGLAELMRAIGGSGNPEFEARSSVKSSTMPAPDRVAASLNTRELAIYNRFYMARMARSMGARP